MPTARWGAATGSTCRSAGVRARSPRSSHGAFALYLEATAPDREVTGVDVDAAKLASALAAAAHAGLPVTFVHAPDGALPAGPWDAITVVDVLYLLGRDAALALVAEAAGQLAPGGTLAVKEIDVLPRWKYELARAQELVSTRVTRITEGAGVAFVPPDDLEAAMTAAGLHVERVRLDRRSVYPHLLLVGRREVADG